MSTLQTTWQPGDPLYTEPTGGDLRGEQVVRQMVQLLPTDIELDVRHELLLAMYAWCPRCDVYWNHLEDGHRCWMCHGNGDLP